MRGEDAADLAARAAPAIKEPAAAIRRLAAFGAEFRACLREARALALLAAIVVRAEEAGRAHAALELTLASVRNAAALCGGLRAIRDGMANPDATNVRLTCSADVLTLAVATRDEPAAPVEDEAAVRALGRAVRRLAGLAAHIRARAAALAPVGAIAAIVNPAATVGDEAALKACASLFLIERHADGAAEIRFDEAAAKAVSALTAVPGASAPIRDRAARIFAAFARSADASAALIRDAAAATDLSVFADAFAWGHAATTIGNLAAFGAHVLAADRLAAAAFSRLIEAADLALGAGAAVFGDPVTAIAMHPALVPER